MAITRSINRTVLFIPYHERINGVLKGNRPKPNYYEEYNGVKFKYIYTVLSFDC